MANVIRFDCYEADLASGQLRKNGVKINLRDQSFQVLVSLLECPGQVVTREKLRRRLWRDEVFVNFENNLNTAIARLREALGDSADHPRFVETLPKYGYRFLAKVAEGAAPVPSPPRRARLVVLPFLNLSGDSAQEYFSDAITDEIITALASVAPEHLAVIARTTAMHYKGSHVDVARIRRELDVDYLVEGAVRRTEDHIAINVQLIQASDQSHLFARKYNAVLRDLFAVENSIAQAIGANVNIPATKTSPTCVVRWTARKPTQDLAAYDAYIRGRYYVQSWIPEHTAIAKQYFEDAVARDPEFALAHDALAETYWWMGFLGFVRPKDAFSTGVFSALRAIEIDPTLAQTHALLGIFRKELDYNWAEVQREMKLALELDPESPVVRFRYAGSGLMPQGHLEQSAAELERALESDPLSLLMRAWFAEVLYLGRQYERSLEQCRSLMQLDPTYFLSHFGVGQIRCEQGLFDEAITALRKAAELSGNAPLVVGWLGMTLARSGDAAGAREMLSRLHTAAKQKYVLPTSFAWIHLGLGETNQAFTWMERAIDERDPIIIPIKSYAFLDPLRNEARLGALLRKMNLSP